jgi:hypothetical protein
MDRYITVTAAIQKPICLDRGDLPFRRATLALSKEHRRMARLHIEVEA